MKKKKSGIYAIVNKVNGKMYIGSTRSTQGFSKRWASHKYKLNNNRQFNDYLQKSWNKYGADNFEFIILEECSDDVIIERENYFINKYETMDADKGYNLKNASQTVLSEESKLKISNSLKRSWKNGKYKYTKEHRELMSKRMKGKNNPMYGISLPRTKGVTPRMVEKLCIPVIQLDMDGREIRTFTSIIDAHRSLNTLPNNSIKLCCNGIKKQAYGYKWKFSKKEI